jgi:hypothetical protein
MENVIERKPDWKGHFDWVCEKWSEEAVAFARKRLERDGVTHIQEGVMLGPSRIRDRVASLIAGRDVAVPIVIPRFIPITHGISSTELRRIIGEAEVVDEVAGNLLLNEGIQQLEDLMIAVISNQTASNCWTNTTSYIGVGDTSTAAAATQTELSATAAAANRFYKVMNATYPSRGGATQTVTFQSDFTSTEANFAWQEWTIAAGATGASGAGFLTGTKNLNRKAESLGTKATGTWTLSGAVTIS